MFKKDRLQPPQTTAEALQYFLEFVPIAATDGYEQLPETSENTWRFRTPNGFEWIVTSEGVVMMCDEQFAQAIQDDDARVVQAERDADD